MVRTRRGYTHTHTHTHTHTLTHTLSLCSWCIVCVFCRLRMRRATGSSLTRRRISVWHIFCSRRTSTWLIWRSWSALIKLCRPWRRKRRRKGRRRSWRAPRARRGLWGPMERWVQEREASQYLDNFTLRSNWKWIYILWLLAADSVRMITFKMFGSMSYNSFSNMITLSSFTHSHIAQTQKTFFCSVVNVWTVCVALM